MASAGVDTTSNNKIHEEAEAADAAAADSVAAEPLKPVHGFTKKVVNDTFDEWALIGESSFTNGFVVQSLRTNDSEFIQVHGNRPINNIESGDISKGKGFMSTLYKAVIYFADDVTSGTTPSTYTTILKVPGARGSEEARSDMKLKPDGDWVDKLNTAHMYECLFYEDMAALVDMPVPKIYKTLLAVDGTADGLIHMQDLSPSCKTSETFDSLTQSQVFEIARHLARAHKLTMTTTTSTKWQGKYTDNQFMFTDLCKMFADFFDKLADLSDAPETYKKLFNKFKKISANPDFVSYAFSQSWKDLKLPSVLVHGDMWGGNIMWTVDEFGHISNKVGAFVDWQLMHEGSIMADLARVMTMCTDGITRRGLEETVFEFYLEELRANFEADGLACPVTLDQIKSAYQVMFLTQAFFLPFTTVFFTKATSSANPRIHQAKVDNMILRNKHVFEDVDKVFEGELKWIFEKFNC